MVDLNKLVTAYEKSIRDSKWKPSVQSFNLNYLVEVNKIKKEIEEIYPEYNDGKPHETSALNKARKWNGKKMKTLTDDTTSKLAELLLQGINMGIIEGRRILNKKEIDNKVNEIVSDYVSMQEMSMEVLKKYL